MIDWGRVSELRDEIGADDFAEVVELFLTEVEAGIEELRAGSYDGTIEAQLHFLKGSALNLGFSDFSKHCKTGETAAANGDHDKVNLAAIVNCYDASKAEFLSTFSTMTAT